MDRIGIANDGRVIAMLTEDEARRLATPPPPLDWSMPYYHVSQQGTGASLNRNDCGAACAVSIIRAHGHPDVTVDDITAIHQRPNKPMLISEVRAALTAYGVGNDYQRPLYADDIAGHIYAARGVIALVDYELLPYKAAGYESYTWPHYILCYAVRGDLVLYHDPLSDGRELTITRAALDAALVSGSGNMAHQGIVEE